MGHEPKRVKMNGIIKKIEIMINNNFISFIVCKIKFFFLNTYWNGISCSSCKIKCLQKCLDN